MMSIALNLVFFLVLPKWYESTGGEGFVSQIYSPEVGVGYAFYINLFCSAALMLLLIKELTGFKYVLDRALLRRMLSYRLANPGSRNCRNTEPDGRQDSLSLYI